MGKDLLFGEHFAGQGEVWSWWDGLNDVDGDGGRGVLGSPSEMRVTSCGLLSFLSGGLDLSTQVLDRNALPFVSPCLAFLLTCYTVFRDVSCM